MSAASSPEPSPPSSPTPHDTFAALRISNYRRYALGFLTSGMGLQILATAVGWEIYHRTQDPMHLGYAGLARALPVVLFALVAGQVADRFERKRIIVITQSAFALAAFALAIASYLQLSIFWLYVLLSVFGFIRAFAGPARNSYLPQLIPQGTFHNAVTWNSVLFQLAATLGPLLAGALIAVKDAAWLAYAATAAGTLIFAVCILATRPSPQTLSTEPINLTSTLAGAKHIWTQKEIFGAITLDLFAVLLGGATALLPMFAAGILHVGPVGLGALRSATYVGALLMGLYLANRPPFTRAGPALIWSVVAFGVCMIVFGFSTSFWLSLFALAASGAVDNISVVIRHVLVQNKTPDHLRGRVGAVNSVFIECSNELGGFESGLVAKFFGPVVSVVSGGIGTIMVAAVVCLAIPQVRRMKDL
jgi:MFS family permease